MVPLGQAMHSPLVGGSRLVVGWPEPKNMKAKLPAETLQTFQPLTSLMKSYALLRLIQCRVKMCEMSFACACVNVRMRSKYIT